MPNDVADPATGATFATRLRLGAHVQRVQQEGEFFGFAVSIGGLVEAVGYTAGEQIGDVATVEAPRALYRIRELRVFPEGSDPVPADTTLVIVSSAPGDLPAWGSDGSPFVLGDVRAVSALILPLDVTTPFGAGGITIANADVHIPAEHVNGVPVDSSFTDVGGDPTLVFAWIASGAVAAMPGAIFTVSGLLERVGVGAIS